MKNKNNIENKTFLGSIINFNSLYNLVFFVAVFVLLLLQFNPMMFTGGDNAYYISLADSIFQKGTYQALFKIGTPYETAITPGYPFLLGLTKLIFPTDYIALKYLSFIMFFISMIFAYLLLRKYGINRIVSYGFVLLMVLSNPVAEFSSWVLTEATFMAFSFIGIYYLEKKIDTVSSWKSLIIPSIFIALSVYIRFPSIMIFPTVFLYMWLRKNFKIALKYTAITTVIILPWLVWMVAAPNSDEGGGENLYLTQFFSKGHLEGEQEGLKFSDISERVVDNFDSYFLKHFPDIFVPQLLLKEKGKVDIILGIVLMVILAIGVFNSIKSKVYFPSIYLILYIIILLLNKTARQRYLIVALPMFFVLMYHSFLMVSKLIKSSKLEKLPIMIFVGLLLIPVIINYPSIVKYTGKIRKYRKMGYEYAGLPSQWVKFLEVAKWVKSNSPEDAIVLSRKPRMFYLYSGRCGDTFLYNDNPDVVMQDILDRKADMVILDQVRAEAGAYLYPTLIKYENQFQVSHVTEAPETYAIRVLGKVSIDDKDIKDKK